MARKKTSQQPESRRLEPDELRQAIKLLQRRISELEAFDVSSIIERWDAGIEALETKINDSLAQIFGRDSQDYNIHSTDTLDTIDLVISYGGVGDHSTGEIRASILDKLPTVPQDGQLG